MPRLPRIVLPNAPHHITQRGNNKQLVFFTDGDRQTYLSLLQRHAAEHKVEILGYCLMANHVHILASPATPSGLARAFGRAHNDYARWLHIRRNESGHLWQNRFFSCPVEDRYLWAVLAYIERNPLRAGLVSQFDQWRWSSAPGRLSPAAKPAWLNIESWSRQWTPDLWRLVLKEGLAEADLRARLHEATQTGRPFGQESFVTACETQFGRCLQKQKRGRKPRADSAAA